MLLSYTFEPSVVKYGILSNNRRSKLHAVIDCLFFILLFVYFQISQRDILNSIDREMSGDVKAGFKCIGMRR